MRINTLKFTHTCMTRITHMEQLLKFQTGVKPQSCEIETSKLRIYKTSTSFGVVSTSFPKIMQLSGLGILSVVGQGLKIKYTTERKDYIGKKDIMRGIRSQTNCKISNLKRNNCFLHVRCLIMSQEENDLIYNTQETFKLKLEHVLKGKYLPQQVVLLPKRMV